MKKNLYIYKSLIFLLVVMVFACRKSITSENTSITTPPQVRQTDSSKTTQPTPATQTIPYPQTPPLSACSYAPNYGDSIIYPQPTAQGQDYIVSPINNPGQGTYIAWPGGMVINPNTGAIDVSQSETGGRYTLGFVKSGTTDTCLQTIILAGADYLDSVYVLSDGQTLASPYYNADPAITAICDSNSSPNGPGCQYDITGSANSMKVIVNNKNGTIDLQKTLSQGAFGLLPVDGMTIYPTIYYSLNDGSNNAVQKIQVQLIYYTSKSLIPQALLSQVLGRRLNALLNQLINLNPSPRPPIVIISRFN
jgi:hypothetical protein